MNKTEAIKIQKDYWMHHDCNPTHFIEWLYKNDYLIISPEEKKKIDGMTVLAHIHGMNPFEKLDKK